ncbi:MAG TPA: helix-turn-helix domain-containing protein [Desulfotomaculum sp.]|nr:helix-turn-helix domain-containing protein [Desulfotomaculum sp.]
MDFKRRFEQAGENPFVAWRKEQGLTRAELARLLGTSYNVAYGLEKGHYPAPLPERLVYAIYNAGLPFELITEYTRWRRGEPKEAPRAH